MIDAQTYALLQGLMRREGRSLLQYVSEAFPWTTAEKGEAAAQLRAMAEEENAGMAALARLLTRNHRTPPYLGSYPMDFTTLNFVSLEHLLPQLAASQRRGIAAIERDLNDLIDPEVRDVVGGLLAKKHQHLQTLEKLADAHTDVASGAVSSPR